MSPTFSTAESAVKPLTRRFDEAARLEVLRNYRILDTPPETVFDDLVRLAAYICGTPISLVSLLDAERQWFKAEIGLGVKSTPRHLAFCQHAILSDKVYEVEDATQDPIFKQNALVTGDPNIRFYAGAPLITPEGQALGTICTIDTVPRRLTEEQRDALRILAREVVSHLELRRARLQLEEEKLKLEGLLRMANDTAESFYLHGGQNEIFIKQDHKLLRVNTSDIRYVEALGDYVNIYSGRERYTVYSTMKELEAKLPLRDFARVHRKYIVRLDRIIAIENDAVTVEAGRSAEQATSVLPVPIGSSYKAALLSRLNLI
ncbi:LytTR family transcriptional regulator DNA-binding domain-containing protein [Hymenobacter sublimis]|uniref:LytTR family transcriptional regulator DNA-binding domain-containing protein n=1 Tax=Hymenobacter sublimis TaxID=2933777 RepID=A0ABY4J9X7_9BACT|nr:LytTR family transcriptional regulator DNA-binding domain-containing protein [Hymenobacter sublimis]UPL48626.1 LytTR family transcriptional regulator DNA-binding domain-containing protein [Hymenobacter sublimis]